MVDSAVEKDSFSFLEMCGFRILELITNANIARLMVIAGSYIVFLRSHNEYSEIAFTVTILLSIFGVVNNFIHTHYTKKLDDKPGYYAKLEKRINLSLSKLEYFIPLVINSFTEFNALSTSLIVTGTIIVYSQHAKNKDVYAKKIAEVKEIANQEQQYIEDDLPDSELHGNERLKFHLLCRELIWEFILSLHPWSEKKEEDSIILAKRLLKIRIITMSITLFGAMHHQLMKHQDKIFIHDNLKDFLNSLAEYAMPENISYLILILILSVQGASVAIFSTNESIKKYNHIYGNSLSSDEYNSGTKKNDHFFMARFKKLGNAFRKDNITVDLTDNILSQGQKSFVKRELERHQDETHHIEQEESLRMSGEKIDHGLNSEITEISKELKTEKFSNKNIDTESKVNALAKKKEVIPQRYIQR